MPIIFAGQLHPVSSHDDNILCVTAEPVVALVPEIPRADAGPSTALVTTGKRLHSALISEQPITTLAAPAPPQHDYGYAAANKRTRTSKLTYFVCTKEGCGWSGSKYETHAKRHPECTAVPCTMNYEREEGATKAKNEFLAKCTQRQRQLGLAPDGEKPTHMMERDGSVDTSVFYLTVPQGLQAGARFDVPKPGGGDRTKRTYDCAVPAGKVPGDLITLEEAIVAAKKL